ncbi:MAG: hypothetical protein HGA57_06270 [Chlorobium limicola]|uniref:STAS/SEC14 domain-containing protein n=1 Tax=Chlorobium limicola (strain DSM 245 / NBRC 103803 / 6330) TaxID=290315 RepID=B3EDH1_CHLL2|nr:hypothetical protein [Chlorobium limicola]ACD90596.1 conserved hypothetical protein [Chlorobium limicola DSM 245]NTV20974.1 hypothetical protein [Chlorobium limicola]
MSIQYTTRTDGNILFVRASGFDENLEDVEKYAQGVIDATLQHGTTLVLCDETALDYRLGTVDTYAVGKFLASRVPRVFKIAIVCNPTFNADARFYENVVVNRGLNLRMFSDIEKARSWLTETERN